MSFQAAASQQGRNWEAHVESWLAFHDWSIIDRRKVVDDVEIDLVATDPNGVEWWVEAKGSHRGRRPGCERADTVKKAVSVAYHLRLGGHVRPYALVTSHLPLPGSAGDAMLKRALTVRAFTWAGTPHGAPPRL